MYNGIRFTNQRDIEKIVETAFRILETIGACVENSELIGILIERFPESIFIKNDRICFKRNLSEEIFFSGKDLCKKLVPSFSCGAEIYEGYYLDPIDNQYKDWDEEKLISYIKLAKSLPNVNGAHMLGCPLNQLNVNLKPLYEKLYCFKYGISYGGAIWDTSLCEPLMEVFSIYADEKGKSVSEVFSGAVYLLTPLKFGRVEAEQLMWFYHRNVRVGIGILASVGLSVPVSLAGALAEHLAEQILIGIINKALFNDNTFSIYSGLSCADLRNGAFQYGRPEEILMNNALSDIAAHYKMHCGVHGGLSDAKSPGYEAAVQKIATASANMARGRNGYIAAGLLSVDEVGSPVQMVLDNEASGYLKRVIKGFAVDDVSLAFDTICKCVEENMMFIESEHTIENLRENLWMPTLFSKQMFNDWATNPKSDFDLAREKAIELIRQGTLESEISESCENEIRKVIRSAAFK